MELEQESDTNGVGDTDFESWPYYDRIGVGTGNHNAKLKRLYYNILMSSLKVTRKSERFLKGLEQNRIS